MNDTERITEMEIVNTAVRDQLILIRLADVDLSSGKKYAFDV